MIQQTVIAIFAMALAFPAAGQSSSATGVASQEQAQLLSALPLAYVPWSNPDASLTTPSVQQLVDFKNSEIKFDLQRLVNILRDPRHEGWVLAAYPDPKTSQPLIGAGFSLDLPARAHLQHDPLNPHPFLEPSSAQLWQAAGLKPARLLEILEQFHQNMATWSSRKFRKKIKTLEPQITNEDATLLVRIGAIQAIYNAKAYCRNFDSLTASQQMALSQLVYQMGVNLEQFSQFLNLINNDFGNPSPLHASADTEYWKSVQRSLIQSQWARLYRVRAKAVIAMLDPQYTEDPALAERRVGATLTPAVAHRSRGRATVSLRTVAYTKHPGKSARRKPSRAQ
jgi:hypothetical protein